MCFGKLLLPDFGRCLAEMREWILLRWMLSEVTNKVVNNNRPVPECMRG